MLSSLHFTTTPTQRFMLFIDRMLAEQEAVFGSREKKPLDYRSMCVIERRISYLSGPKGAHVEALPNFVMTQNDVLFHH